MRAAAAAIRAMGQRQFYAFNPAYQRQRALRWDPGGRFSRPETYRGTGWPASGNQRAGSADFAQDAPPGLDFWPRAGGLRGLTGLAHSPDAGS